MDFILNSIGNHTFLTYDITDDADLDHFSFHMLLHNKIEGLLPFSHIQMDQDQQIRYDVTAKVSLEQFKNVQQKKEKALNLLRSIAKAFLSAEKYMLEPTGFVLDNRYIYVNYKDGTANLVYYPLKQSLNTDVLSFLKNLVVSLQYDPNEDIRFVTLILNKYNNGSISDIPSLIAVINELTDKIKEPDEQVILKEIPDQEDSKANKEPELDIIPTELSSNQKKKPFHFFEKKNSEKKDKKDTKKSKNKNVPPATAHLGFDIPGVEQEPAIPPQPVSQPVPVIPSPSIQKENPQHNFVAQQKNMQSNIDFNSGISEDVTALMDEDATVLIPNISGTKLVSLKRISNGQVMQIHKQQFRLGKDSRTADFYIGNNATVSKNHAMIIFEAEEYFLVDNNSTNHTYVNGEMLIPGLKKRLEDGAKVRLSNEEFEFSIK